MEQNKKFKIVSSKKTRYLLPNILTLGGVCLGISSIKFSIDGNFSLSVTLILLAAIFDALDGRIARLIKGTSEFGKESRKFFQLYLFFHLLNHYHHQLGYYLHQLDLIQFLHFFVISKQKKEKTTKFDRYTSLLN